MTQPQTCDVLLNMALFLEIVGGTNNKSIPYHVRSAWIGPRPDDRHRGEVKNKMAENVTFKQWLQKHKMSEDEFIECVRGTRNPRPFFPFVSEAFNARIGKSCDYILRSLLAF